MTDFIHALLAAARKAGIEAAEVYTVANDSFRAMCQQGDINNYTVNSTRGLSLRGLMNGKMGYASTQAFDEDAIRMLVTGVKESASLIDDDAVQQIYPGDGEYPVVDDYNPALDEVSEDAKLRFVLEAEKAAKAMDPRIVSATYDMVSTESGTVRIVNSYGLDLSARDNMAVAFFNVLAKDGDRVATGGELIVTRDFSELNAEKIARKAVDKALYALTAEPVPSGTYRCIFDAYAMSDMLGVFSDIFSAEEAQDGTSLLAGKEGETIASPVVTLVDDPLLPGGLDSRGFDDEGVRACTKAVVENGVLKTLLHSLKTAAKAGVKSTGNGRKAGYDAPIHVAPSNFFFRPGEKDLQRLMADMGDGLVITEVSGLHAGANSASGDFSLIAEGYTVKNGVKDQAVERITVAGNFYQMLKNVRAVGSDLVFPGSGVGSPSVDVGEVSIAGR